jgi:CheY-like chemotaxis protein
VTEPPANRHVGLIVEDNEPLRKRLAELLASFSVEPLLADNRDDALAIVRRRRLCFAFLDVELPLKRDGDPEESTGLILLGDLRQRPGCGYDELWVMIMTGLGPPEVLATMAMVHKANDFAKKPIFDYFEKPPAKIRRAIEHCERHHPDGCPALAPEPTGPRVLRFVGTKVGHWHLVKVDTTPVRVGKVGVEILWRLKLGHDEDRHGWIHGTELYRKANVHQAIRTRLMDEDLGDYKAIVEFDEGRGRYRLLPHLRVEVDEKAMRAAGFDALLDELPPIFDRT